MKFLNDKNTLKSKEKIQLLSSAADFMPFTILLEFMFFIFFRRMVILFTIILHFATCLFLVDLFDTDFEGDFLLYNIRMSNYNEKSKFYCILCYCVCVNCPILWPNTIRNIQIHVYFFYIIIKTHI